MNYIDLLDYLKHRLNRRAAAGLLVVLLLLSTVSPGFTSDLSPKFNTTDISLSSPPNSHEFAVSALESKTEYSPYLSNPTFEHTYSKKSPTNQTSAILQSFETRNNPSRSFCFTSVLPYSLHTDSKFFYLITDIPPPFSNI